MIMLTEDKPKVRPFDGNGVTKEEQERFKRIYNQALELF